MVLSRRGFSVLLMAAGALLAFSMGLAAVPSEAQQGGSTGPEEFACASNEREVESFSGSADQTFPEFQIRGPEWRFIVQAEATTQSSGNVFVDVAFDPENPIFGTAIVTVDPEFFPTDTSDSSIIDGPATAALEVDANGARYEILVCENTGDETTTEEDETSVGEISSGRKENQDRREEVMSGTFPKKRLVDTGGVPVSYAVYGCVLAGTSLLVLGLIVRRGARG